MAGLRGSTATATIASASTVLASLATEAAARDTSNVSDCGLFWQRTQETTVALASLVMEAIVFSLSSHNEGCGNGIGH
jgi:hypothetical protein